MSELPTLTDEQIDQVIAHTCGLRDAAGVDRWSGFWKRLRAAFPAPTPPRPEPLRGPFGETLVEVTFEGKCVSVYIDLGNLNALKAREVAAKIVECAEWVEQYGKAGA